MDMGWLETFENYYKNHVYYILNDVIESLSQNINRTFILSEMGYIIRYMEDTQNNNESNINRLKEYIQNNRIEIVNGGYSANDEATSYYEDIID